jgi:DNA-binding protein HU-beta
MGVEAPRTLCGSLAEHNARAPHGGEPKDHPGHKTFPNGPMWLDGGMTDLLSLAFHGDDSGARGWRADVTAPHSPLERIRVPMTKAELIDIIAEKVEGVSKADIARIHDAVFETITRALEVEGRYNVAGFGSFDVRARAARKGRNPKTGEEIDIPASKNVGFKPGSALKDRVK